MSERVVGMISGPFDMVGISSGANQRTEPPLEMIEPWTSCSIENNPKSARHGVPSALINMLCWKGSSKQDRGGEERDHTNTFQATVNNLVGMQIIEATDYPKQLDTTTVSEQLSVVYLVGVVAHQFQTIDGFSTPIQIIQHVPVLHPLGHHATFE